MKRNLFFPAIMLAAMAGCSQQNESDAQNPETVSRADMAAPEAMSDAASDQYSPNVGITAAPGVAFNYRYAFRVPNAKIAAVQEQHAQMCEALGIARCRITGMRYKLVDSDTVSAMLAFKLDPSIARDFGKQGIAKVDSADGMLVDSEISGVDEGANIEAANINIARGSDALAQAEARAKNAKSKEERLVAQQEADRIRQSLAANRDARNSSEKSLATTPMVFNYGSGDLISGFSGQSPLRDAAQSSLHSFVAMLGFIIMAIGILLPWALLLALGIWLYRRFWPANLRTPGARWTDSD